ncbi:hypothetical protein EVAR_60836_1 [Eumeta japonica]|uniref:Uncharacterized protein n=1 Tax=Eumeta variegata TaxID=151549 RepID=A0A4C1Y4W5_EUMVA|nr:hypothetical protein EVAR_60836_1 [Eumeta japonica]
MVHCFRGNRPDAIVQITGRVRRPRSERSRGSDLGSSTRAPRSPGPARRCRCQRSGPQHHVPSETRSN